MDSIDLYVRDVGRYATLSWDEQLALFRRRPDPDAERQLVEANLRLVVPIVGQLKRPGDFLQDLIQVGNLALLKAVKRFDPERGFRFSTYATKVFNSQIFGHRILSGKQLKRRRLEKGGTPEVKADLEVCFSQLAGEGIFQVVDPKAEEPWTACVHQERVDWIEQQMGKFSPQPRPPRR